MENKMLKFILILGILFIFNHNAYCFQTNENLVEYSFGAYGDGGGLKLPILFPPLIKIYQDGLIIFKKEDKYYSGILNDHDLNNLKSLLRKKIKKDKFYYGESRNFNDYIGFHGGVIYVKYLEGENQKVIATNLVPKNGLVKEIIQILKNIISTSNNLFLPNRIAVRITKLNTCEKDKVFNLIEWPFDNKLNLIEGEKVIIDKQEIIKYLFQNMQFLTSFIVWNFCSYGNHYSLTLGNVDSWFNSNNEELEFKLMDLAEQEYSKHKNK